jgi:hypothetical protein
MTYFILIFIFDVSLWRWHDIFQAISCEASMTVLSILYIFTQSHNKNLEYIIQPAQSHTNYQEHPETYRIMQTQRHTNYKTLLQLRK